MFRPLRFFLCCQRCLKLSSTSEVSKQGLRIAPRLVNRTCRWLAYADKNTKDIAVEEVGDRDMGKVAIVKNLGETVVRDSEMS